MEYTKKQLRGFGYLIGFGVPFIFGFVIPFLSGHPYRGWIFFISFPILFLGLFNPYKLALLYKSWMGLGHALGWINSRIILGLVFLLVLQPLALLIYEAMVDAVIEKKSKIWNWGGTWQSQKSLLRFKSKWNTIDTEYRYLIKTNKKLTEIEVLNKKELQKLYRFFYTVPFNLIKSL